MILLTEIRVVRSMNNRSGLHTKGKTLFLTTLFQDLIEFLSQILAIFILFSP